MLERIGSYRILEEIGSGGMAVIYKALHESLNRVVAVKALKSSVAADSHFAIRFEREALTVSSLQHENIVHIYDFYKHQDGALFIVMEHVDGIDLFDLLERTPQLPIDVAAIIALGVARALDHAHYHGIIHRDVKPANVMIAKNGVVKLMDFGIARDKSFGDLTEQGTGLGTPSYMSPEQIVGDKLDFRSDLFSVGILLYQMVCGKKPFVEDEQRSVMHKIRVDKYPPPRRVNNEIPRALEAILKRCLQKRREDRWQSTQQLIMALERFLADRVDYDHRALVVHYLRDQRVLSIEDAAAQLSSASAGGYRFVDGRQRFSTLRLRRLIALQAGLLGVIGMALAILHATPSSSATPSRTPSSQPTERRLGKLRVLVTPWAHIIVDGHRVDTTPLVQPIELTEGEHTIELRHPKLAPMVKKLDVRAGELSTLKVSLDAGGAKPE